MRVIALETSGRSGSIAALQGECNGSWKTIGEMLLPSHLRTAQSLVPALGDLLAQCQWEALSIDLVCVATGPGSFTGLRIGVTTAKTFAYAAGADLVATHTLAVLAAGVEQPAGRLWAILNAQRQELFAACFALQSNEENFHDLLALDPAMQIVGIDMWLSQLQPSDSVVGPPLEKLAERLPGGVKFVDQKLWQPSAVAVGQLGIARYLQGEKADPMQLIPHYYRKSAAEEKAEQS